MATFTMDTSALWELQRRIISKTEDIKKNVFNSTVDAFQQMTDDARKMAGSKLPKLANSKGTYKRTGNLSRSIGFTYGQGPNGAYFRFFASAKYAPYVEFGTGSGYGLPSYRTPELKSGMDSYSAKFKGVGSRKHNMPYRSYFFVNVDKQMQKMFKTVKSLTKK